MKDAKNIDKQWVLLNDLAFKLVNNNVSVPESVFHKLRISNSIISYYILDEHATYETLKKAEKELNDIQSILFTLCDNETFQEYLNNMSKSIRGELNVEFPLNKTNYNQDVKKKGNFESLRISFKGDSIQIEMLGELSEWYGVIFNWSEEEKDKVVISGSKEKVVSALRDFSVFWKYYNLE